MIDKHSPTWVKCVELATARIEKLRNELEGDKDQIKTSHIRGQICALREVIRWPEQETFPSSPLGFEQ